MGVVSFVKHDDTSEELWSEIFDGEDDEEGEESDDAGAVESENETDDED